MKIRHFSLIALLITGTPGCSTHIESVKYQMTDSVINHPGGGGLAIVGTFADDRGTDPTWLGAIRGGYGNPLKKLYTDKPVSEVVEQAFTDALQARSLLGDKQSSKVEIEGKVTKFDCSYYFNREAHAHLLVTVVSRPSHSLIYSRYYQTDNKEGGWGAGIFGNTEELTHFAQRTLNETVDKALADPEFTSALQGQSPSEQSKAQR
jgi:hypothetical protein